MIGGHQPESPARGWLLGPACVQLVLDGGCSIAVEVPPRKLLSMEVDGRRVQLWFDPTYTWCRSPGGVVEGELRVVVDGVEVRDA